MASTNNIHQHNGFSPSHSNVSSAKGSDLIVLKVASVLSTSYSDNDFRDAILLADQRSVGSNGKNRRQLRLDLLGEAIGCNGEIVGEMGLVAERLKLVRGVVERLNSRIQDMKRQIDSAHDQTTPALRGMASLFEQRLAIERKQEILGAIESYFVMTDDEIESLTSTMIPVDNSFFSSLQKAKRITLGCDILLGFESQTLGLELIERTSVHVNMAFQKLYKWVQQEFKTLNLENPHVNPSMRQALRVLAERPSLFQNCLDLFAASRERSLSEAFHCALTGVTPQGTEDASIRPIDLTAHDPLRYVGDMFAWVHSATVGEREALETLFAGGRDETLYASTSSPNAARWNLPVDEGLEGSDFRVREVVGQLMDRNFLPVVRILRQRVEQAIQSNEDVIPAYKISTLLSFYRATFEKLLGVGSSLEECTGGLEKVAKRQFRSLVRDNILSIQAEFQQVPSNLEPPRFLQDAFKQLGAILQIYESSLSASEDSGSEIQGILSEAFDPFMSGCEEIAKPMTYPEGGIFLVNCKLAAAHCLGSFESTIFRATQIRDDIAQDALKLIDDQHAVFRRKSGLDTLLKNLDDGEQVDVSQASVSRASQELDDFLPSALMDAMDRLKGLQDAEMAREIIEQAAERFCTDFERLEEFLANQKNGEDASNSDGSLSLSRTSAEIRVLLS
ncbi:intra-golgi transport complex, subunit 6 [Trichoderma citrinoviride]|uniref:Conserved oligomeric Golgi complex subunit 6 n=1 Tax=Trichoderma citrinoviride TaxID=58853 RepID=A0A2T4B9T4_9HYPO|nr:intra-golgi transport complex, subunit 6 [Trichoderma citrinoviride]PTB66086.1 intra-golgi transport complex, subunit 6 [Trichoderma citrinoviride]